MMRHQEEQWLWRRLISLIQVCENSKHLPLWEQTNINMVIYFFKTFFNTKGCQRFFDQHILCSIGALFSVWCAVSAISWLLCAHSDIFSRGGYLVQKTLRGCAANMGSKISLLVYEWPFIKCKIWYINRLIFQNSAKFEPKENFGKNG